MESTTRLSLPYPDSSDDISAFPPVSADQMVGLDNAVLATSGVIASRPSSTSALNDYYATDNGRLYKYNGSAWILVFTAHATYSSLTLTTNVNAVSGDYTPSARIEGDKVVFRGSLINGTGSSISTGVTIFTMPSGMVPSTSAVFMSGTQNAGGTGTSVLLEVASSGAVTLSSAGDSWANGFVIALNGLEFSLI